MQIKWRAGLSRRHRTLLLGHITVPSSELSTMYDMLRTANHSTSPMSNGIPMKSLFPKRQSSFPSSVATSCRTPDYPYEGLFAIRTKFGCRGQNCLFTVRTKSRQKLLGLVQMSGQIWLVVNDISNIDFTAVLLHVWHDHTPLQRVFCNSKVLNQAAQTSSSSPTGRRKKLDVPG